MDAGAANWFISVSSCDEYGTRVHGRGTPRRSHDATRHACGRTAGRRTRSLTGLYRRLRNRTESAVLPALLRRSARGLVRQPSDAITAGGELHRTLRTCCAVLYGD